MTPVDQSCLYLPDGIGNGDCFPAALASLLEIPLWMVPPFHQMYGRGSEFHERLDIWLKRFFGMKLVKTYDQPPSRGVYHSVVYLDGNLVHDPHPSREGLKSVEWCWYLKAVGEPLAEGEY
jgi:hypothetical protein